MNKVSIQEKAVFFPDNAAYILINGVNDPSGMYSLGDLYCACDISVVDACFYKESSTPYGITFTCDSDDGAKRLLELANCKTAQAVGSKLKELIGEMPAINNSRTTTVNVTHFNGVFISRINTHSIAPTKGEK